MFSDGPEKLITASFSKIDFKVYIPSSLNTKVRKVCTTSKSASGVKLKQEIETELNKALFSDIRLSESGDTVLLILM